MTVKMKMAMKMVVIMRMKNEGDGDANPEIGLDQTRCDVWPDNYGLEPPSHQQQEYSNVKSVYVIC